MMSIDFGRNWNVNGNLILFLTVSTALHFLHMLQLFVFHAFFPVCLVGKWTVKKKKKRDSDLIMR